MKIKILLLALLLSGLFTFYHHGRSIWVPLTQKISGKKTTAEVLANIGENTRQSLVPYFEKAGIDYPPPNITLVALKREHMLELWVKNATGKNIFIRDYKIQKLSGEAGPKLREGDRQVPEGFYKITGLNPNSAYHLSIKLDYPNLYDLQNAKKEGRVKPGSNIFIHGKSVSIGCLAMGDKTIEELFTLVNDVGVKNSSVIISPHDPRSEPLKCETHQPKWVCDLYWHINNRITLGHPR
jgi:murein L,D-transpeptidase YafK